MSNRYLLRIFLLLLLIPAVFLQGCFFPAPQATTQPEAEEPPVIEEPAIDVLPDVMPPITGQFSLRYDPNSSLNPIMTLNRDNILLSSLLYESLFVLNGSLDVAPLLADNWSSDDNVVFTFEIKPDIAMSDGSLLTADDVAYSLRQAMQRGRYVNRFRTVSSVAATGDLTVTVELYAPNSRFIRLLDVPIIKNGSIESRIPPGTGPFIFAGTEEMRLDGFPGHRDYNKLPISTIYLRACNDNELTELFDEGKLSFLWDDPADVFDIRLNRLHDRRFYDTTMLQFIGFNANHIALRNPDVRRAISVSIERQFIIDSLMSGQALAAPLALSPAFHLYDTDWEHRELPPLREMAELLVRAGLEDANYCSFLELLDGFGGYYEFTIDFIVNRENIYKVNAAHMITNSLRRNGLDVVVRELPWDRFISALQTGDFDMYYGEIMLGADFNLTPLLLPGGLNYGKTASTEYRPYLEDFLTARTDDEIRWAAGRLVDEVMINAPFAPILYKRHAVYTPIGAIFGIEPSQSGAFFSFSDWVINMYMLT